MTLATTGRPNAHTCGGTEWSTWSEAESCAGGLSWTMRTERGKLIKSQCVVGPNEMEAEALGMIAESASASRVHIYYNQHEAA